MHTHITISSKLQSAQNTIYETLYVSDVLVFVRYSLL